MGNDVGAECPEGSVYWRNLAKSELFNDHTGPRGTSSLQGGQASYARGEAVYRWDPYERFVNSEDIRRFYSGHRYARYSLVDRERFARFAIREVLKDHPEDRYTLVGEIMKDEHISLSSDSGPQERLGLAQAIRADGQLDVDAEIVTTGTPKDDVERTQRLSSAAQTIIAASPHSLGPPINPCVTYLRMTKCGRYGRDQRSVWTSPFLPTLDNRDGRRGLLDHQVTGVVWLLSRLLGDLPTLRYVDRDSGQSRTNIETAEDEANRQRLRGPRYFGGILADSMGLGKTLITVALIHLLVAQRLNVIQERHHPILLVVPNATVASQWVQEIENVIPASVISKIVVAAPGLEGLTDRERIVYLQRGQFDNWRHSLRYMWQEGNPEASKAVLIATMECWAHRTCKYDKSAEKKADRWGSTFSILGRAFSLVIVDEAYKIKNSSTLNWQSINYLERQFTLLITATPCMNSLTDLFGLARLLWTAPERYLQKDPENWKALETEFSDLKSLDTLDRLEPWDDWQLIAGRPALLAKLLCRNRDGKGHDIDLTRQYLRHFERLAMLRRSPSSRICKDWGTAEPVSLESVSLDGLYPNVENYTVEISAGEAYDKKYQKVHVDLLIDYLRALKAWVKDEQVVVPQEGSKHWLQVQRLLQIATSSLDVYHFNNVLENNEYSTKSDAVAEMRRNGVTFPRLAPFLQTRHEARPATAVEYLKLAVRNSPILRYVLHYIAENILTRKPKENNRKLLIVEQVPVMTFYYEAVLRLLGFECCCMHAHLSFQERQALVDSFNRSDAGSCQILIQPYTVGFVGTNLQKSCSRVLVTAYSYSLPVQWQAIHRVIRVGQNADVTVHRVKMINSYHTFQESLQVRKILPELGSRAQGQTKGILVQLLNLFQHEVHEAWHSPEGQRLMEERNLLLEEDSEEHDRCSSPPRKRVKLEHKTDGEESEDSESASGSPRSPGSELPVARLGDGEAGWHAREGNIWSLDDFLSPRPRDEYRHDFIDLPRKIKGVFDHEKNDLRRLLSFGYDAGRLSTAKWKEEDLEHPAVLERALELMLRVRLGAREFSMVPFPLVNLSRVPKKRRQYLQRLLSELSHVIEKMDESNTTRSSKDMKEIMKGIDVTKPLDQIDKALAAHGGFGPYKAELADEEPSEDAEISAECSSQSAKVKVKVKREVKEADVTKSLGQFDKAALIKKKLQEVDKKVQEDAKILAEFPTQQVKVEVKTEVAEFPNQRAKVKVNKEVAEFPNQRAKVKVKTEPKISVDLTGDSDDDSDVVVVVGSKTKAEDRVVITIDDDDDDDDDDDNSGWTKKEPNTRTERKKIKKEDVTLLD
ncbi:P-loop containing nucleoside triphosphate hydrolase protein [Xylariaceae sp. FL0594]|nr:P-loop containing nucleoside triphosphate hydrolase protein [Xylariaceae sp. FL0594]